MNSNLYQVAKKQNNIEDDYEEEIPDNSDVFNDNNIDFLEFKKNVNEWMTLDDDIIKLQNAIKERKIKKNELTPQIMKFMDKFKVNDLNTGNGKLKFTRSLQTKPLNKDFLTSRLSDFFKDFSKGEKAALFILENRDKTEVMRLRRVQTKKEVSL